MDLVKLLVGYLKRPVGLVLLGAILVILDINPLDVDLKLSSIRDLLASVSANR